MTHITTGVHDTPLWPRVTPLYPDGHVGVMSFNSSGFTLYDQENPEAWVSVKSDSFVRDVEAEI